MVKMKTRKKMITLKRLGVLWAVVEYQEFNVWNVILYYKFQMFAGTGREAP